MVGHNVILSASWTTKCNPPPVLCCLGRGRTVLPSITLGNSPNVAFKEILVFSQFKCAEFKSEFSFFLQALVFLQFEIDEIV